MPRRRRGLGSPDGAHMTAAEKGLARLAATITKHGVGCSRTGARDLGALVGQVQAHIDSISDKISRRALQRELVPWERTIDEKLRRC